MQEQQIIGQTYYQQEKRRMELDLEQQALRDVREEARKKGERDWQNAQLTPDHIAKISALSAEYAKQADALRELEEVQYRAESSAQDFYDTARTGFVDVIKGTASLSDALSNLASKFADFALNSAFDSLFGGSKATSSGGWLTNIFKGLGFSEGGYTGDGGKYQPAGVVHKGEYVFDKAAVKAAGGPAALEAMRRNLKGYANGGAVGVSVPTIPSLRPANDNAVKVNYAPVIDARGADAAAVARLEKVVAKQGAEMQGRVEAAVRSAQKRNVKLG